MSNSNQYKYEKQQQKSGAAAVNVAAVVKVTAFDPAKMTVDVQPLSKRLEGGNYTSQPPILGVPVACTKGGGFVFRPWYKAGDIGAVVYIDHDIDKAVAGGAETEPNTERNHSTSDAVFIGGIVPGNGPISGIPSAALALGTDDGSIYIAVTAGGIEVQGDVNIKGNVTITGGDATADGISLKTHTHTGDSGGSTSSPN